MNQIIVKNYVFGLLQLIAFDFMYQILTHSLPKVSVQGAGCDDLEWDCDNGQCIPVESRCDGHVDCADGSDETSFNCIQNYKDCTLFASNAFACAYGACVIGTNVCNGRKDCADNSDELFCNTEEPQGLVQGHCKTFERKCKTSRQWISMFSLCDGHVDCKDGSDESLTTCVGVKCPPIAFRCGYGACVSGHARCNGTRECLDGSDEAWELCGYPRTRPSLQSTTVRPTSKPHRQNTHTPAPTRTPSPSSNSTPSVRDNNRWKCQIPENTPYLVVRLHPDNVTVPAGTWVDNYDTVHLECSNHFLLSGEKDFYCFDGKWNAHFPTCAKYCPAPSGLSTLHYCLFERFTTCRRVPPNTEVAIRCAPGYVTSVSSNNLQTLYCNSKGQFEGKRNSCVMNCGQIRSPFVPLTKNGLSTQQIQVPWQVAIYLKADGKTHKYICAGSIVSPSVVISAAHCFWDVANLLVYDPKLYEVATGKLYNDFYVDGDQMAQKRTISEIKVYHGYNHNNFQWDIAILRLSAPLIFNANISSVCLMLNQGTGAAGYVPDDRAGLVVGWGQDGRLEQVPMKTRSYHRCRQLLENGHQLAEDKFCVQNEFEATVCRGDSGSGFVVFDEYRQRYHLWGVVSYAPYPMDDCARNGIVAVSNVNYMHPNLQNALQDYQQRDTELF